MSIAAPLQKKAAALPTPVSQPNDGEATSASSSGSSKRSKADPILQVMKRNKELERRMHKVLSVTGMLIIALIASVGANLIVGTRPPPKERYVVQQIDGTLVPIIPLNEPITNKHAVTQLVTDAINAVNALDFANYRGQLFTASAFFTPNGWKKYETELQKTDTLGAIVKRQLVVSGSVSEPPVVTKEYEIGGIYAWDVEAPFQVSYFGAGYRQSLNLVARVTVVRIPTTTNPRGVAIAGFNAVRR